MAATLARNITGLHGAKLTRRRFLRATTVAGSGLAAAALFGCSATSKPPKGSEAKAPASSAVGKGNTAAAIIGKNWGVREPDAVPKSGGTLNWAYSNATLPNLDPLQQTAAFTHYVASLAFSHLLHVGTTPNNRNETVFYPDLATSWEVSDPLKMTFKLRSGAKY